jgi:hypothetical protein
MRFPPGRRAPPFGVGAAKPKLAALSRGQEATRRAFYDRVIAEKGMIAGYHFGFPNVGTLTKDGNGYAFAVVKV